MSLLAETTSLVLWQDLIKHAEKRCAIDLKEDLESYLVFLLMRYLNKPEMTKQILGTAFLESLQIASTHQRQATLQVVGDQCLLLTGLFPHFSEKKLIKINYFVRLGQAAYSSISTTHNDLYESLSMQFVVLMDVLQSIRENDGDWTPFEAYEQWQSLGSKHAFSMLKQFTQGIPQKFAAKK
jgi:hypothetical protein